MNRDEVSALVEQMIAGVSPIIDEVLNGTECDAIRSSAVSSLGVSIAVSPLRCVREERAAREIAAAMSRAFAMECAAVIAEIWADRGTPQ